MNGKVKEVMTKKPTYIKVDTTIDEAAKLMAANDFGILPVSENDKLVGMITDRDITIRVTAKDKDPAKTKAKDVMTEKVLYCFEDDTLEDVLKSFGELQIYRMPVMNANKRLVGEITLGDIAKASKNDDELHTLIGEIKQRICS